ncbi:MAG: hypothetical protein KAI70_00725 [Candidatus Omnitrophica bacterium]|nr:hypothetical protein [Candidatus Omnitrophota bacterium]
MRKIHWAKEYGVNPRDLQPIMRKALLIVDRAYERQNKTVTVTCTGGGSHIPTSLHPWGYAFDVRIWILTNAQKGKILHDIKQWFTGGKYQIVREKTHFHIEYDDIKMWVNPL